MCIRDRTDRRAEPLTNDGTTPPPPPPTYPNTTDTTRRRRATRTLAVDGPPRTPQCDVNTRSTRDDGKGWQNVAGVVQLHWRTEAFAARLFAENTDDVRVLHRRPLRAIAVDLGRVEARPVREREEVWLDRLQQLQVEPPGADVGRRCLPEERPLLRCPRYGGVNIWSLHVRVADRAPAQNIQQTVCAERVAPVPIAQRSRQRWTEVVVEQDERLRVRLGVARTQHGLHGVLGFQERLLDAKLALCLKVDVCELRVCDLMFACEPEELLLHRLPLASPGRPSVDGRSQTRPQPRTDGALERLGREQRPHEAHGVALAKLRPEALLCARAGELAARDACAADARDIASWER
eukprot:4336215-Prymnesium_polylepis.2